MNIGQNRLRKQAADAFGFLDAFDAEAEGGQAHRDFLFAGEREDLGEDVFQYAEEFVDDFGLAPEEALQVLHAFEVADDDAARVAEDVGNDEDFRTLVEDDVGFGRGGAVGGFGEDAALDFAGVGGGELPLQRRGNKNVAREHKEFF